MNVSLLHAFNLLNYLLLPPGWTRSMQIACTTYHRIFFLFSKTSVCLSSSVFNLVVFNYQMETWYTNNGTILYKQTRRDILPLVSHPLQQVPELHNWLAPRQPEVGGVGVGGEAVGAVGVVGPLVKGQSDLTWHTFCPFSQRSPWILHVLSGNVLPVEQISDGTGAFFAQMYFSTVLTGALVGLRLGDLLGCKEKEHHEVDQHTINIYYRAKRHHSARSLPRQ